MKKTKNWAIFRVRGIIKTAENIYDEFKHLEALRVITVASLLLDKLKEKK